jgi:NAD(P)-dependent dehydrogenase (short-subunit alcohol dehydrogenase family)
MEMGLLDGKVAVITGAGSGMGKASVEVFVREGAKVVAADISGAEKDTAAEVGEGVLPIHCDTTNEAEVEAAMRAAVEEFGQLNAVCNVAGIADAAMLADVTTEHYNKLIEVDLRGVFHGIKQGIRVMLEAGNGGAIVNWASLAGLNAAPFTSVYSAAKAGVISFTKAAAVEYAAEGIRTNCLCPGFIYTAMSAGAENIPGMLEKSPMNRGGQAHEVAEVGAFLASDRASYLNGVIIPVDGGWAAKLA